MNTWRTLLVLLFSLLLVSSVKSQTFNGEWICEYATIDDQPNATGYNTPSLAVISEDKFVALVRVGSSLTNYLVGYTNADSLNGRMGFYGYGSSGIGGYRMQWSFGFDAVEMREAIDIAASSDSKIYVANNDIDHNILVFEMSTDSIISTEYRLATGADSLWAIDVDDNGYVYVTSIKDQLTSSQVLVFPPVSDPMWTSHTGSPLQTITLPAPGELRGIAVNGSGTVLYVSNYQTEKIYCYVGSPTTGYVPFNGFDFTLTDVPADTSLNPGPWGLGYMNTKNILFVAADVSFRTGAGYSYGKIYALNPNTGAVLDTIDTAEWNFAQTGAYNNRPDGGLFGTASGYASTYNVDFDENFNLYDQSYYGWTVDKWSFTGELPVIPLTIVSVEKEEGLVPDEFMLMQNYPNPFNPSTTIEFSLPSESDVTLKVYSVNGELITTLINSAQFEKGSYKLKFDASKLASGTYVYVLQYGDMQLSKKMTLVK
jgi:hypothetical protein